MKKLIENPYKLSILQMLKGKCPICFEAKIFKGAVTMNDNCPNCSFKFERETGYFLGAMHFSYIWAGIILVLLIFILTLFFPDIREYKLVPFATILLIPFVPISFRYSRIVWIYFDLYFDRNKK